MGVAARLVRSDTRNGVSPSERLGRDTVAAIQPDELLPFLAR